MGLQKAKNSTRRAFVNSLQALSHEPLPDAVRDLLQRSGLINARLDKVAAVTKDDVQRVANKYLRDTNRTIVITMPKARGAAPTGQ